MTSEDYHERETPRRTLDDLYRVVSSIDDKVSEIADKLGELARDRNGGFTSFYDWDDD